MLEACSEHQNEALEQTSSVVEVFSVYFYS